MLGINAVYNNRRASGKLSISSNYTGQYVNTECSGVILGSTFAS